MQFRITGLLLLGAMALPPPGRTNASCAAGNYTNMVAATNCRPSRTYRSISKRECHSSAGEKSGVSQPTGILYQMSGSTEVALDGEAKMLNAGEGCSSPAKDRGATAGSGGPSTFLHFFLVSAGTWVGLPRRHLPP